MRTLVLILALCLPAVVSAEPYLPGDVFLTRNANEADNTSPGYWNHCAIYVGDGLIIEAQAEPGAVIYSQFDEFVNRYPQIRVLRVRVAPERYGVAAASRATQLVGTKYRMTASISRVLRIVGRGDNCVSTVRRCYRHAWQNDPRWRTPDGVNECPAFWVVFEKGATP